MSFGSFDNQNHQPMAEINTTPLVDVMLVLLIIFMITAPLMTHSFQVDLPATKGSAENNELKTYHIEIDQYGDYYWQSKKVSLSELKQQMSKLKQHPLKKESPSKISVLSDKRVQYQKIADLMAVAKSEKIEQLSFKMLSQ